MENKKETRRYAIYGALIVLLLGIVAYGIGDIKRSIQRSKEEFYAPVMVSDSSFHVNLSDQSCMLVEIANGTMTIHTNNADMVGYDKTANKVFVFYHDIQNSFTIREYYIDSLLGTVPDTTIFDNH